jgi:alpha-tubulin suppressor-like RCC1 family protein
MHCSLRVLVSMLLGGIAVVASGCREDAESPTAPEVTPALSTASAPLSFLSISSGSYHTCGVAVNNRAYCWGNNQEGQLGDGTTTDRSRPVAVARDISFLQVSAGYNHTCGVSTNNRVYCWGLNDFGQLGATNFRYSKPALVSGGFHFSQVNTGGRHTCAVTPVNLAYCWGDNSSGQLGDGTTTNR